MKLLLLNLKALAETVAANVLYLYDSEPARVIALLAGVAVYVARTQGFLLDDTTAKHAIGELLAIVLAGEGIRRKVKPADL